MMQLEIEIPLQPPRVTLHRARALRDELIKKLSERNPDHATEVNAIALRFQGVDRIYHALHSGFDVKDGPVTFIGKKALFQLREVALFIARLEQKGVRYGAH